MSVLKWLKGDTAKKSDAGGRRDADPFDPQRRDDDNTRDPRRGNDEAQRGNDDTKYIYFHCSSPQQNLIDRLQTFTKTLSTFNDETECIEFVKSVNGKAFLIVDGPPQATLIDAVEPLKIIDSLFVYSAAQNAVEELNKKQHTFIVNWCQNESILSDSIQKSREELDKQTAAFSMYNKKEKATRDLSKEAGSFLFFQLFKSAIQNMPKTDAAKKSMVNTCRDYYRGNLTELKNIDDFDKTYRSEDAIPWYTKETFVYK